ncbi:MAG: ThiF family adenylyltransferase, partial [Terriglobia bacterium]
SSPGPSRSCSYESVTLRNIGILSQDEQRLLRGTGVAVAGCGVGSLIAQLAARTGFGRVFLADGDSVEPANLNRQAFTQEDIGCNKAVATARAVERVNPSVAVRARPEFVTPATAGEFVSDAELVVDTIDMSALSATLALHEASARRGLTVFYPLNLGWGSGLYVFRDDTETLSEMLGCSGVRGGEDGEDAEANVRLWATFLKDRLPQGYLEPLFKAFVDEVDERGWCPVPQLGIAAFATASLTVAALTATALGKSLRGAPHLISFDPLSALHGLDAPSGVD